jgi:hypothetical protein
MDTHEFSICSYLKETNKVFAKDKIDSLFVVHSYVGEW